jgi:hypothetical protein
MLPAAAFLFAGALLFQSPAPAPAPPSPPPDERKPAVALDPELRRAVDALRATNGMRFEAVVNAHAAQPRAIATATREAPQREPDVGDDVRLTVLAPRDRPMHVEHERVDAWRLGERVAWRARDSEEWQLFVLKRESAEAPPAARPHPAALRDGEDARLLRVVAQLATPRELLDEAEGRITSCAKVSPREGEEAGTVFECALEPDVARRVFASLAAGDAPRIDALTAAYALRIGVDHGQIATLALEHRLPLRAADGAVETLRRYRIRETGNLEVEVPEEVKRLLDGSGAEVAEQKSR